jgi:lipoate-protein ligase A
MTVYSGRLMIDSPAAGSWNMAVDQALLEQADQTGEITLRLYAWDRPTLSLGYFQRLQDRERHPPSLSCPVVRRTTGGGAILHDQEVTYSLCVPSEDRWSQQHERLYWIVHQCIIKVLRDDGHAAVIYSEGEASSANARPRDRRSLTSGGKVVLELESGASEGDRLGHLNPFLCFQRRTAGDIVSGEYKVVGSAQRRKRNAVIQHGTILLSRSDYAPELPGLENLGNQSQPINRIDFISQIADQIGVALGIQWTRSGLGIEETHQAEKFEELHLSSSWLAKQNRAKA